MTIITCPIEGCEWKSQDLPDSFVGVLTEQLQMHNKSVHQTEANTAQARPHVLKIDPPKLNVGASPEHWESFTRQWVMYKTGTNIPNNQTTIALFHCCNEALKQDLMRDIQSDITLMSEEDLLKDMRRLAVKEESILVHRMKLGKMVQAPGMGIRTYLANLRGQAALCKFSAKCIEPGWLT